MDLFCNFATVHFHNKGAEIVKLIEEDNRKK
jgi:hypothetical protein